MLFAGFEMQKAVKAALAADAILGAMVSDEYDFVRQGATFPYIVIVPQEELDYSTLTEKLGEVRLEINVISRSKGRKQAQQIISRVAEVMEAVDLEPSGFSIVNVRLEESEVTQLEDGETFRGKSIYRIVIQES